MKGLFGKNPLNWFRNAELLRKELIRRQAMRARLKRLKANLNKGRQNGKGQGDK